MSCDNCPMCGQFCDFPRCIPGYVEPPPPDLKAIEAALLLHAAAWEQRQAFAPPVTPREPKQ